MLDTENDNAPELKALLDAGKLTELGYLCRLFRVESAMTLLQTSAVDPDGWEHDLWRGTLTRNDVLIQVPVYKTGVGLRSKREWKTYANGEGYWYNTKTVKPRPEDVLYGMLMSLSACEQSYHSWCSEFGYDMDSRRHLETYLACQEEAESCRKLLGYPLIERFRAADH